MSKWNAYVYRKQPHGTRRNHWWFSLQAWAGMGSRSFVWRWENGGSSFLYQSIATEIIALPRANLCLARVANSDKETLTTWNKNDHFGLLLQTFRSTINAKITRSHCTAKRRSYTSLVGLMPEKLLTNNHKDDALQPRIFQYLTKWWNGEIRSIPPPSWGPWTISVSPPIANCVNPH